MKVGIFTLLSLAVGLLAAVVMSRFSGNGTAREAHVQLACFQDLLRRMNFPE